TVDAVPMTTTVLAIIESTADLPVRHNEVYADDSCFELLGRPGARSVCQGAYFVPTGVVTAPDGAEPQAAANASFLVIRTQPLTTAKSLGTVGYGVTLDVTGRSTDGRWFQVNYKGGLGWVLASLTVPNAAARAVPIVTQ